ncbi:MAG: hypothetical protein HYR96_06375 [Deltaproteobacteria bacterium]|nr:hypothetical protein [Deltaproteobacteria bacterium]MBI3295851.1 hypothetical protein [Deltaproteobacteria bacterium]
MRPLIILLALVLPQSIGAFTLRLRDCFAPFIREKGAKEVEVARLDPVPPLFGPYAEELAYYRTARRPHERRGGESIAPKLLYRMQPEWLYSLAVAARRPEFRPLIKRLGIRNVAGRMELGTADELNAKLHEMGCPWEVVVVKGILSEEEWLGHMREGRFPLGKDHDAFTHLLPMLLMPPRMGYAQQGQIGILTRLMADPSMSPAVVRRCRSRLNDIMRAFEAGTTMVGEDLLKPEGLKNTLQLASDYRGQLSGSNMVGAEGEISSLLFQADLNPEILGLTSRGEVAAFRKTILGYLREEQTKDFRYRLNVPKGVFERLIRDHFENIFGG